MIIILFGPGVMVAVRVKINNAKECSNSIPFLKIYFSAIEPLEQG